MQLQKYIWISQVGEWMKYICNLTDKFVAGIILSTQIIVSSLLEKKYQYPSLTGSCFLNIGRAKILKNSVLGKLIYGHLITSSCLMRCWWQMTGSLACPTVLLWRGSVFKNIVLNCSYCSRLSLLIRPRRCLMLFWRMNILWPINSLKVCVFFASKDSRVV